MTTYNVHAQIVPGDKASDVYYTVEASSKEEAWDKARSNYKKSGIIYRVVSVEEKEITNGRP